MTNVLIICGTGQLSKALAERPANQNSDTIVIVDNLATGSRSKIFKLTDVNCVNMFKDAVAIFWRFNLSLSK